MKHPDGSLFNACIMDIFTETEDARQDKDFEIWSRQSSSQLGKQYSDGHVLAMFWYC